MYVTPPKCASKYIEINSCSRYTRFVTLWQNRKHNIGFWHFMSKRAFFKIKNFEDFM